MAKLSIFWWVALSICVSPAAEKGSELASDILGTWRYQGKHMGSLVTSINTFHEKDKAYTSKMEVRFFGKTTKINFEGVWSIEDGKHVVVKVTKSTSKVFLPVGKVIRMDEARVDDKGLHYKHDGKPETETRVTSSPG